MRLHAVHVLKRCAERGYTWDEISPCLIGDLGDGWYEVDVNHPAYPRHKKAAVEPQAPGLGDYVASALDAVGITKARVESVVGGPCGCPERQAALNAAGAWLGLPPGSTAGDVDPPA